MFPLHTTEQIRAAEAAAYATLPDGELMRRAAAGLARAVAEELRGRGGGRVLVAAGPGNNGGDGLYAGALLAARGVRVTGWRTSDRVHEAGWAAFLAAGGRPVDAAAALAQLPSTGLVLDAVYGMGARPGLPASVAAFADACREQRVTVVSCDVPSGLDSDGAGARDDVSFRADRTVSLGAWKIAHVAEPARSRAGRLSLVPIGLALPAPGLVAWEVDDLARIWPYPDASSDKYSRGVVGLDTGSHDYPGAGVLSAHGAVYAGAGMVRCLGPAHVSDLVRRDLPNVVGAEGRVQSWVLGSGWGERADAADRVRALLATGLPLVIDADALGQLPGTPLGRADVLLTPHAGELARLLGTGRAEIVADPVASVRAAAERLGACVLLKGATQYVAEPGGGHVTVAVAGPAWTAQAGSGDVLAGICGTLLAAGLRAAEAALAGASVQAITAAANPGPYPPQEIARRLPAVIAGLRR